MGRTVAAGRKWWIPLVVTVVAALVVIARPAEGATIVVTTTVDGGAGSLRAAVAVANGAEATTIQLAAGEEYQLTCPGGGDLDHTGAQRLTIDGNGGATIRQTCANERVIESSGTGGLELDNVTITGGHVPNGETGGGLLVAAQLVLDGSTVTGNSTSDTAGGGIFTTNAAFYASSIVDNVSAGGGGGAWVQATASVDLTTIADNEAQGGGGGIAAGILTMDSSTVSGNSTTDAGGGFMILSNVSPSSIQNSTISGNSAGVGGGGLVVGQTGFFFDTFAGNEARAGANLFNNQSGVDAYGTVFASAVGGPSCELGADTVGTYNYDDDGTCGLTDPSDVSDGADPMLGALADNGGIRLTMLPADGSPLIDGGGPDCPNEDQRGQERPAFAACDIGAVEVQPPEPPISGSTTTATTEPGGGGGTTTTTGTLPEEPPAAAPQPQQPSFAG